ncbi:HNH endonuclease family protein [Patulibacter minatonensis]|uniref:HNH endonuclease family protein n=1 Tax=Patulibacter minatonensis TaxID=298163 RepID=UPI0004797634|nr:HNH endonuclease family protein [Patulibacter minatonensis]
MRSPSIRRPIVVVLATAATAVTLTPAVASAASTTLKAGVSALPGATESRTGYERSKFKLWIDADSDGCDTRREVLIDEAVKAPTVGSGCSLTNGSWTSPYDGERWTDIADLDIDHVVPLAEAWDSGASKWTATRRESYANDLSDPRTLIAVTDSLNQAKGDKDPAEWEPPLTSYRCTYAAEWVSVKLRWGLTVDTAERSALASRAAGCPSTTITYTPAG